MADWKRIATDALNSYVKSDDTYTPSHTIIEIDTLQEDTRSKNYLTLNQFNDVEYDSEHLWFCQIDGAPAPFDKWFPAQSIIEPTKSLSVTTQSFGLEEVNTLNMYNAVSLRTELLDNDKAVLETWLRAWQADCAVNKYYGFRYLEDILHTIYITKYDWQKTKVYTHAYYVVPTGDITVSHNNEPAVKSLNVNFAVFGQASVET